MDDAAGVGASRVGAVIFGCDLNEEAQELFAFDEAQFSREGGVFVFN